MVFNREKYFIASKIFDKNKGNSVDIYFTYIRVSTHGHVQNIGQNLPKPFLPISRIWNISTGNIFIKSKENQESHKCILWSPCKASSQLRSLWFTKMPQNPLWPESNLNNFVLQTFSPCPTFVSMFTWPNEATTPSGSSRGSYLLN